MSRPDSPNNLPNMSAQGSLQENADNGDCNCVSVQSLLIATDSPRVEVELKDTDTTDVDSVKSVTIAYGHELEENDETKDTQNRPIDAELQLSNKKQHLNSFDQAFQEGPNRIQDVINEKSEKIEGVDEDEQGNVAGKLNSGMPTLKTVPAGLLGPTKHVSSVINDEFQTIWTNEEPCASAAYDGSLVRASVSSKSKPVVQATQGNTKLEVCVRSSHAASGASLQTSTRVKRLLYNACKAGATQSLRNILATDDGKQAINSFNVKLQDGRELEESCTPLMLGIPHGSEFVSALIDAGANVNLLTRKAPRTMLIYAMEIVLMPGFNTSEICKVIEVLLKARAPVNGSDVDGRTALDIFIQSVTKTLRYDASVDPEFWTMAEKTVEMLLKYGSVPQCDPLQQLMTMITGFFPSVPLPRNRVAFFRTNVCKESFKLIAKLVELLLTSEAKLCIVNSTAVTANVIIFNAELLITVNERLKSQALILPLESMLQSLFDIFCSFCVAKVQVYVAKVQVYVTNELADVVRKLMQCYCVSASCLLIFLLKNLDDEQFVELKVLLFNLPSGDQLVQSVPSFLKMLNDEQHIELHDWVFVGLNDGEFTALKEQLAGLERLLSTVSNAEHHSESWLRAVEQALDLLRSSAMKPPTLQFRAADTIRKKVPSVLCDVQNLCFSARLQRVLFPQEPMTKPA